MFIPAEQLKGCVIYAAREDIPIEEGSYFISDMLGLPVIDQNTGKVYGTLKDVNNLGASDLYVVSTPLGDRMIPAVPEFVASIDIDKGIFVTPIPGLLEDESKESR
jgi:16S rRNA processing protein RimM